jgi:hypothetical protein
MPQRRIDRTPAPGGIRDHILVRIDDFLEATGVSERRLGLDTVHDAHLVRRLRLGHGTQLSTLEKLEVYMAAELDRRGLEGPRGLI